MVTESAINIAKEYLSSLPPDFFEMQMELFRRRRKIDLRIEPHPFDEDDFSEDNPVAVEIMNTGIEILNDAQIP